MSKKKNKPEQSTHPQTKAWLSICNNVMLLRYFRSAHNWKGSPFYRFEWALLCSRGEKRKPSEIILEEELETKPKRIYVFSVSNVLIKTSSFLGVKTAVPDCWGRSRLRVFVGDSGAEFLTNSFFLNSEVNWWNDLQFYKETHFKPTLDTYESN